MVAVRLGKIWVVWHNIEVFYRSFEVYHAILALLHLLLWHNHFTILSTFAPPNSMMAVGGVAVHVQGLNRATQHVFFNGKGQFCDIRFVCHINVFNHAFYEPDENLVMNQIALLKLNI